MSNDSTLTFIQHQLPALDSGEYTVNVSQAVTINSIDTEIFQTSPLTVFVSGIRFQLDTSNIQSVFPPANQQGYYGNVFPHVILTTPTLPWQRGTGEAASTGTDDVASWLGVMTFGETDPPPALQSLTLNDLITPPAGTYFPPLTLEPGQQNTDPVTVIDIPVSLFNAIAPSVNDLAWLAHVRTVDVTHKVTIGDNPAPGTMSLVISNRLPPEGMNTTSFLISFENYAPVLPADDGTPSTEAGNYQLMRMVVLYNWTFMAETEQVSFAQYLEAVNVAPAGLQQFFDTSLSSGDATADASVQNIINMGYTGFAHLLRNGDNTVSWYRGPLLPYGTQPFIQLPFGDADQLMRYDPGSGMFDTSYAAAWQLGRLLALNDRNFALAFFRWRTRHTSDALVQLEQNILNKYLHIETDITQLPVEQNIARIRSSLMTVVKQLIENFKPQNP
ncbi:hypothetical protein HDF18_08045 [Mucilaginibacter sp. X5P1]|uniref:hypothetical protein n=1 Tax=Mucilaginibacter sp. X5P1 TaxID=2723088 RepID=UPI00161C4E08|nr:hypothetical protein [Mucilaginibacter sp. X5P1]MBB6137604.1 hypothetical protein [Mucilaginibacter sp. X5P1]